MSDSETPTPTAKQSPNTLLNRFLDGIEKVGNKLPDPAVMFFGMSTLPNATPSPVMPSLSPIY